MGGLAKASFSSGTKIYKLVKGVGVSVQMSGLCLIEGITFGVFKSEQRTTGTKNDY